MQSKILVLLLLATVCLCVNKEIAVYFNLLDDNGNGVVTAAEMGLFLDRFHEEHEEIVMTSEIWDNMDTRNSLYKILNATNKYIFQRQQDAEWTLTLEEFEQAIQRFNKVFIFLLLIRHRFATALMWTQFVHGKYIKLLVMTLNTKW